MILIEYAHVRGLGRPSRAGNDTRTTVPDTRRAAPRKAEETGSDLDVCRAGEWVRGRRDDIPPGGGGGFTDRRKWTRRRLRQV